MAKFGKFELSNERTFEAGIVDIREAVSLDGNVINDMVYIGLESKSGSRYWRHYWMSELEDAIGDPELEFEVGDLIRITEKRLPNVWVDANGEEHKTMRYKPLSLEHVELHA